MERHRAGLVVTGLPNDEGAADAPRTAPDRPPVKLVLVAVLLPLVLLGAAFLRMLSTERSAALEQMLERSAVAAEMAIRLYVGEEIGRLEGLAASSALDTADWAAFQREAGRLLDQHPHWLNIIVTNDHQQLFNGRLGIGRRLPPLHDLDSVRTVWESRRPAIGNMAPGAGGRLGAAFRVPVIRDGVVRYTLVAPAAPTLFSRVLHEQNLPAGWVALAIDANGIVIGHSADADQRVGKPLGEPLADALHAVGNTAALLRMPDGMDHRIFTVAAVSPGWRVAVMAPAALVGAPARFSEYAVWAAVAAGAVLAVVLIGALLSAVTSRRMLDDLSRAHAQAHAGEAALRESEAQFRTLAESMPALLFVADEAGANIYTNPRFREYAGVGPDNLLGDGWRAVLHPEDQDRASELWGRAVASGNAYEVEYRFRRHDGVWRWFLCRAIPQRNDAGLVVRWIGTCTDIQAMREAEERLRLLMREVDHRAKNALTVVQSILRLSRADDPAKFSEAVEGRVNSMAHAHTLLSASRWSGALLGELVTQELAAFRTSDRVDAKGPVLAIRPEATQAVALVLHELATNAAKYGALAAPAGKLTVTWSVGRDPLVLRLVWSEQGGPAVPGPPERRGFGMVLIAQVVDSQLGGRLDLDWRCDGLCCTMEFPGDCFTTVDIVDVPPKPVMPINGVSQSGGRRILVVEDEAITALAIAQTLEQAGFTVLGPVARVAEAIDLLQVSVPDAAVLDVNLFGNPVRPVAEALSVRGIPFLFCTGYQDMNHAVGDANDAPVLSKPVAAGTLIRTLTELMDQALVHNSPEYVDQSSA